MYYVYILKCKNGSLYTGYTPNLVERLEKHKVGKGSKYVRAHLPFELVHKEEFENKIDAMKREYIVKKLDKKSKLKLCNL